MFKFGFSAVDDATEPDSTDNNTKEQNLKLQAFEVKPEDDVKVSRQDLHRAINQLFNEWLVH